MRKLTIMIVPDGVRATRQLIIPSFVFKLAAVASLAVSSLLGFCILDYWQLREIREAFRAVSSENQGLKGEGRILMQNLEEVKRALRRVEDYTTKLSELTTLKVQKFSKTMGIGPLSPEEYQKAQLTADPVPPANFLPIGVNTENLVFKPIFSRLATIGKDANRHSVELQQLLSSLSQQRSLLSSIPSISPVNGWITSGYGQRISPFTGDRTVHSGIDVAAPVGTPIVAPADGVVIFSGAKEGYGNFLMIAHGYGVVTRYGHNHQNLVEPGQRVARGEQIGTVGSTGRTTGPHLHYEIWLNGNTENPKKFLLDLNEFKVY